MMNRLNPNMLTRYAMMKLFAHSSASSTVIPLTLLSVITLCIIQISIYTMPQR